MCVCVLVGFLWNFYCSGSKKEISFSWKVWPLCLWHWWLLGLMDMDMMKDNAIHYLAWSCVNSLAKAVLQCGRVRVSEYWWRLKFYETTNIHIDTRSQSHTHTHKRHARTQTPKNNTTRRKRRRIRRTRLHSHTDKKGWRRTRRSKKYKYKKMA